MLANKSIILFFFALCGYFLEHPWKKTEVGFIALTVSFAKTRAE